MFIIEQKTVGLSFAGGGVHSWAEVAAVEMLEKENIEISAFSGTSMGSFIAAAFAFGLTSEEVNQIIIDTDLAIGKSKLFGQKAVLNILSIRQPMGLVLMEKLKETLSPVSKIYGEVMLSDVPKPLAITSVDTITGNLIIFSNQPEYFDNVFDNATFYDKDLPLVDACLASSAYPIVLTPVKIDDYQLIDGGVLINSPSILFSSDKIEHVIALRTGSEEKNIKPIDRRSDVAMRAIDIMIDQQVKILGTTADTDYVMRLSLPGSFEFGDSQQIISAGRSFISQHPIDMTTLYKESEPESEPEYKPVKATVEKGEADRISLRLRLINMWKNARKKFLNK